MSWLLLLSKKVLAARKLRIRSMLSINSPLLFLRGFPCGPMRELIRSLSSLSSSGSGSVFLVLIEALRSAPTMMLLFFGTLSMKFVMF